MPEEEAERTHVTGRPIAVLGAGLMGRGIAAAFAVAGADVAIYDTSADAVDDASRLLADHAPTSLATTDIEKALNGREFVIEAVPESLEIKDVVLRAVSNALPDAVIATNTSGFRVTELADFVARPERFIGAHFFNPADIVPLVEVVGGELTSPQTIESTMDLLRSAGKNPVRVRKDIPGFIANRLQHALWREAFALVDTGVCSAEELDAVVLDSFGPRLSSVGPMENADYIGLDLLASVQRSLLPGLASHSEVSPALTKRIQKGELGRKTTVGFGVWDSTRVEEFDSRLRTSLKGRAHGS